MNYICDVCDYSTDIKSNYTKHLNTKSHIWHQEYYDSLGYILNTQPPDELNIHMDDNSFFCPHCAKIFNKKNKAIHFKSCIYLKKDIEKTKEKQLKEYENEINKLNLQLIIWQKDAEIRDKDIKLILAKMEKDNEIKFIKMEKEAEIERLKQQIIINELKNEIHPTNQTSTNNINDSVNSNNNNKINNNKNNNNKTISFVYIKNNYKNAPVYSDVISAALTKEEMKAIKDLSPTTACAKLINQRCITNVDMDKRPLHCLDMARKKFAVRVKNKYGDPKWTIDQNGEHILSGVFAQIRSIYPIKENDSLEEMENRLKLHQMMMPSEKKKILREIGRVSHVNAS